MKISKHTKSSFAYKIFKYLLAFIFIMAILHVALQFFNLEIFNEKAGQFFELSNRFDLDDESSFPTWVAQFLFLVVSACAALVALLEKQKDSRRIWSVISIVALIGSIDEVSTLHESILQALHVLFFKDALPTVLSNAWVILLPVILLVLVLFTRKAILVLPKRTVRLFILSAVPYLLGSVVIDIITIKDLQQASFFDQGILVGLEETLEFVGVAIALYAVLDYMESKHKNKIVNAVKELLR